MILRFQLALNVFTLSSVQMISHLIFKSARGAPSAIKHNLSEPAAVALRYVLSRLISSEQEQPTNWQRKGGHGGRKEPVLSRFYQTVNHESIEGDFFSHTFASRGH